MSTETIRITEIFYSLQGESNTVGLPTVFVRLTGCPLRCGYCDSAYAFNGGNVLAMTQIMDQVASYQASYITVTGGEPLAQPGCLLLLTKLCDENYRVSLETSGALSIREVDPRVTVVMDLKTPASGELARNLYDNIQFLKPNDQVKFVICNEEDYQWSKAIVQKHQLHNKVADVLFSPSHHDIKPVQLAEWILADNLPVRFQLQLHKLLWNDEPGR